ncbi:MAG TPA: acyltransferase [Acidimicrobiales bacterium]|nr:acyltransferase [Acidimicrobiales bacterium]
MTAVSAARAAAPGPSAAAATGSVVTGRGFYLRQFDLFRTVAFVGVVAQHSVLWPVTGGAKIGWGSVMLLHATREIFFFLSAFVAYYAQATRPRSPGRLWWRRLTQIVVPYLVWTVVYWTYTMIVNPQPLGGLGSFRHDLWWGYYQLYYAVVLIQFFVLLPLLIWLVRVSRRYHWWVLGGSVLLQLAMMTISHYFSWKTGVGHTIRHFDIDLTQSRLIVGYQLYIVAGLLAADHADDVQRFVARHHRAIVAGAAAVGVLAIGYYVVGLSLHQTPGHASDLYQPVAVVWFMAAAAGLYALGWIWANRSAARPAPARIDRLLTWGSDLSGGFYFAHVLVLQLVLMGLVHAGLESAAPWWVTSVVLFPATLAGTAILVTLLERTPARFALTGPNRTEERATLAWLPRPSWLRQAGDPAGAGAGRDTGPAIGDPRAWAGRPQIPPALATT